MTKLLWHSNAPWAPTGYGQQTALFGPLLNEHYDVWLSANYGLEGAPIHWKGIPTLPGIAPSQGNETIPFHVGTLFDHPREGLVVTLYDVVVWDPRLFSQWNTACWTPVDHNPPPPALINFFRNSGAIPIAMSRFGQREMAEFDALYVPHAVDVDVYKPTESEIRKVMGFPEDGFVVGMVAANKGRPSRKCFQQAFEAFRVLRQRHDDAFLYVHSVLGAEYGNGEDLGALLASLDIPEEAVRFPQPYSMMFAPVQPARMAERYSAFDVLLNPSMGEGFGVPILEAQACGTPVIVTDFTAMPEVGKIGWQVGGRPFWSGQASWQAIPDVEQIVDSLEQCYALSKNERKKMAQNARTHAMNYALPKVFEEHMLPALRECEQRFANRQPVKLAPRPDLKVAA